MNIFTFLLVTFLENNVDAGHHGKNFVEYITTDKPSSEKNLYVLWVRNIFFWYRISDTLIFII